MSEAILEPNEAQKVATDYICQKENVPNANVKIESFEPSSWNGVPVYLFQGKIVKQTIDPTTWQAGVVEKHSFAIWITANEGKIVGYKPGDRRKGEIPDDQLEALREAEMRRNVAEAEYYEGEIEEMERERQERDEASDPYRIDINKFRLM